MQSWAGRGQRADCLTEVDAAESLLLLGNSGDRCLPPSVQKQDGRRTKPQRSPTGDDTIATEGRWSWPPELPPPQVAAPIVQLLLSPEKYSNIPAIVAPFRGRGQPMRPSNFAVLTTSVSGNATAISVE
jgi:hypothetical protein